MSTLVQFGGLVSGLDTGSIIDALMAVERQALTRLQRRQTVLQARRQTYQEINTKLAALSSAASKLNLRGTIAARMATVENPEGGPTVLTASAGPDAVSGSFHVTVTRLATATKVVSTAALGNPITASAPLASAGFATAPTTGTFTLRAVSGTGTVSATLTIDSNTVLSDGIDDASSNSILGKINSAGLGITASIVNDASGRPNLLQLVSDPGVAIQMGAGSDTSNFLTVARLKDAIVQGNTAATVTGAPVAAGRIDSTTITINGVTTVTTATSPSNTAAENAASIAADINNTPGTTVTAVGNVDGTITLTQKTSGASYVIDITSAGVGTGLTVGTTRNGTDKVISFAPLGVVQTGEPLTSASARLATAITGLDANNNGEFLINGVSITFNGNESLGVVLNRINSSSAGVTATYDPLTDKINLVASKTGADAITLQDVTGNFLAAIGVLGATQELGQNALYSIDTVNGGQQLSSASNTISGIVPGVTLELKSASDTPVKVTIGPDADTAVTAVKDFVTAYNDAIALIREKTRIDPTGQNSGLLAGDASVYNVEAALRSRLVSAAVGLTGPIHSLADVGLSFGPVGSAAGTTTELTLDEDKLRQALESNPSAVYAVFGGFSNTATLSGAGSLVSISGAPTTNHESGTYEVVVQTDGTITATFTPTGGIAGKTTSGTIAAGGTNTTLIPGITLTADTTLTNSTQTITVAVQTRGVMVYVGDYLKTVTSTDGLFGTREDSASDELAALDDQIADMEARLEEKRRRLEQKFAALEVALARLQQQSGQLAAQLASLNAAE